jgi:hypothetical protein
MGNGFYDKDDLLFYIPLLFIPLLAGGFIWFDNLFIKLFIGMMFVLCVYVTISSGYGSHTIPPKLLKIVFILYCEKIFLFYLIGNENKLDFVIFHLCIFLFLGIIFYMFLLIKQLFSILKRKEIIYEVDFKFLLKTPTIIFFIIWLIIGKMSFYRLVDGFSEPNIIAIKLYKEASYSYRIGAICSDGTESNSTGSGTCSHHGGVSTWKKNYIHKKSFEKCLEEAHIISWIE